MTRQGWEIVAASLSQILDWFAMFLKKDGWQLENILLNLVFLRVNLEIPTHFWPAQNILPGFCELEEGVLQGFIFFGFNHSGLHYVKSQTQIRFFSQLFLMTTFVCASLLLFLDGISQLDDQNFCSTCQTLKIYKASCWSSSEHASNNLLWNFKDYQLQKFDVSHRIPVFKLDSVFLLKNLSSKI